VASRGQRLTIVQYAGDFREASSRLATGGEESYRGQRYTVDFVEGLASKLESVTTITGFTDTAYDVTLPSGARAIGAGFLNNDFDGDHVAKLVEQTAPNRLILRTPSRPVMRWAKRNRCRTMLLLADSFNHDTLKNRITWTLLRRYLRDPVFQVIANHGASAAQNLVTMGIDPARVIAWDYPAFDSPADRPSKSIAGNPFTIVFVGMLIAAKGVDDLVQAVAILHDSGLDVRLDLVGMGESERITELVNDSGLAGVATLAGVVPNTEIIDRMAAADVVVVPSRHSYTEGMPLTIYEAYCSRTPLVVSDHPMFLDNVIDGQSGLIYPAGDVAALARQLARLATNPALYASLSEGGHAAWKRLQLPVRWGELIDRWLDESAGGRQWLEQHSFLFQD
jgi:glycosyltransferase involved in cell wall biosynthesis